MGFDADEVVCDVVVDIYDVVVFHLLLLMLLVLLKLMNYDF